MKTIALVMIVKNEEKKIKRCIDSVKDFVNEIIIVDTGSTDNTRNIALENGAKVLDFKWEDDFAKARNFSLSQSTSHWNLVLDADEYILSNHKLIRNFIEKNNNVVGRINILSKYIDEGQERVESSYVSRLFPNKDIYFRGRVHEQLDSILPRINIDVNVVHDGYLQSDKTSRNLPLLLMDYKESPNDPYIMYQIGKQFFLKKDYIQANHFFSLAYSKKDNFEYFKPKMIVDYLYSLIRSKNLEVGLKVIEKEKNNLHFSTDFHFVCGIFFMELVFSDVKKYISYFPLIEHEYLNCLSIDKVNKREIVKGTGSYLALYNLGTVYETIGNISKAIVYYKKSSEYKYEPARKRLRTLLEGLSET